MIITKHIIEYKNFLLRTRKFYVKIYRGENMLLSAQKEYIFPKNAVTKSCHASTVLPLSDGRVLAAWFGGKHEKDGSVEIYVAARDTDGVWSTPVCVTEQDDTAHWNPVLYERKDGKIILFYKHGKEISEWITKYTVSEDGGEHWCDPQVLVPGDASGGRGPVKNKCLLTSADLLLAPASTEKDKLWLPFIDISADDGLTWQKTPLMERPKYKGANVHLIQPALWEDDAGIHCFLRSDKGALYRSDSADGGFTWKKPYRTHIPNNNSGIDCCSDASGRLWLVYNPVDENWGVRHPLCLAVSVNKGKTFTDILHLEPGNGEFSYPAIVCRNNTLHITYTHKRKQIVYWKITLEA